MLNFFLQHEMKTLNPKPKTLIGTYGSAAEFRKRGFWRLVSLMGVSNNLSLPFWRFPE